MKFPLRRPAPAVSAEPVAAAAEIAPATPNTPLYKVRAETPAERIAKKYGKKQEAEATPSTPGRLTPKDRRQLLWITGLLALTVAIVGGRSLQNRSAPAPGFSTLGAPPSPSLSSPGTPTANTAGAPVPVTGNPEPPPGTAPAGAASTPVPLPAEPATPTSAPVPTAPGTQTPEVKPRPLTPDAAPSSASDVPDMFRTSGRDANRAVTATPTAPTPVTSPPAAAPVPAPAAPAVQAPPVSSAPIVVPLPAPAPAPAPVAPPRAVAAPSAAVPTAPAALPQPSVVTVTPLPVSPRPTVTAAPPTPVQMGRTDAPASAAPAPAATSAGPSAPSATTAPPLQVLALSTGAGASVTLQTPSGEATLIPGEAVPGTAYTVSRITDKAVILTGQADQRPITLRVETP
ncbi:hypothetical protein [Deinococcus multiflagellatus]|uniref:hypothetical protein n=1 Tax=Deinococcus multiflagellatus TaxID=1656887 RepID=UPI001CCFF093|nr:hypothetical protein [Deinococcus multiflagellatus]MBZ9714404.1 hypothetical protein [Deinococcus multiflagellatus]